MISKNFVKGKQKTKDIIVNFDKDSLNSVKDFIYKEYVKLYYLKQLEFQQAKYQCFYGNYIKQTEATTPGPAKWRVTVSGELRFMACYLES